MENNQNQSQSTKRDAFFVRGRANNGLHPTGLLAALVGQRVKPNVSSDAAWDWIGLADLGEIMDGQRIGDTGWGLRGCSALMVFLDLGSSDSAELPTHELRNTSTESQSEEEPGRRLHCEIPGGERESLSSTTANTRVQPPA